MTEDAPAPRRARRLGDRAVVVGLVLVLAGAGCLGWVGYTYVGSDLVSRHAYQRETQRLRSSWAEPTATSTTSATPRPEPTTTIPGDAIALLRVPRFGADYEVPVLQGTDLSVLADGIGHYEGTAEPGEPGNFAVAGHRITHGQPFAKLLDLDPGDTVVVETRTAVFTYTLDTAPRDLTVPETATWVLGPDPEDRDRGAGAPPTRARITLTTCQDLFRSPDRSVAFGTLTSSRTK